MNPVSAQMAEYELVMMLDPEAPDERRHQIAADALKRIEAGGSLKHDRAWGMRKLAYEIRQRTEADYRFFRFEGQGPLLDELDHNLKITDGVLRFRIFRVDPDSPVIEPPPPVALAAAATRSPQSRRGAPGGSPARGPEAEEEPAEAAAPKAAPPPDQSRDQPAATKPPAESPGGEAPTAREGDEPSS
jgi:small subunit ribosomal protein S6